MNGSPPPELHVFALSPVPEIEPGDDLSAIISDAIEGMGERPKSGDVFVVAQKVVSKSENRFVDLKSIVPSRKAEELAARVEKDPRLVEVVLSESTEILRERPGLIITVHKLGIVNANAGVDRSNVRGGDDDVVLLLPIDPDASARRLQSRLEARFGVKLPVIINDTAGRAWRNGIIGFAIGVAGLASIQDLRGARDRFGRMLQATQVAVADEAAAAASLLQGQGDEGLPVVVIRGLRMDGEPGGAGDLIRAKSEDLFR